MPNLSATFSRKNGALAIVCLAIAATTLLVSPAKARHWHAHHRHGYAHSYAGRWHHRHASIRHQSERASHSQSNIAAIVVDGNTGKTIYARNENEQRFPASITKVMTLYLLFEQLEQGHLRLDSDILISAFAAAQKPSKLGLRPGETISVDDAIKAVVTRSANDIAVAIAESIGGNESHFAALMTEKAHEIGMTRTHFANASGLPDADQLTTAHDLAILGRAIQQRFPRYYRYFATRVFYYRRAAIQNHNHLLGRVEGMDGIKTGYTNASGFNLLTSVKRDGHYIVAVVLGGSSARSRDTIMAGLIEDHIDDSALGRAASLTTTANTGTQAATALQNHASGLETVESQQGSGIRPAFIPGAPKPGAAGKRPREVESGGKQPRLDGSTLQGLSEDGAILSTATPSAVREGSGGAQLPAPKITARAGDLPHFAAIERVEQKSAAVSRQDTRQNKTLEQDDDSKKSRLALGAAESPRADEAQNGWIIQIGATPDRDKATELLARAKSEGPKTLARARAFTEKVQKGSETLYRARFAGLEADTAERICKALKRSGFSCFATRN
jgi:D-alanyl-D-alanine carboxypeptidase